MNDGNLSLFAIVFRDILAFCHVPWKSWRLWHTWELLKRWSILEKLSCLKLVKVRAHAIYNERLRIITDLLWLPRASSKCKIHIEFGDYYTF